MKTSVRKTAMWKDISREIKHSISRFLSIMLIIALGVGFFVSIKATAPSMQKTANDYFRSLALMDIELLSTVGFDDGDLEQIRMMEGISVVEPGYSADILVDMYETLSSVKVLSIPDQWENALNRPVVVKGRLPVAEDECVVSSRELMYDTDFEIGDTVTFSDGGDGSVLDGILSRATYTIVGLIDSPLYFSYDFGTCTVGDGSVNTFFYIPHSNFVYERYTVVYLGLDYEGSYYDKEYENLVASYNVPLTELGEVRYAKFVDDMNKALADAEEQLQNATQEANEKLEAYKKQLEDAAQQLKDAREQLDSGWALYNSEKADAESQLKEAWATLLQYKNTIDENERLLANGEKELADGKAEAEKGLAEGRQKLDDGWKEYEDGLKKLEQGRIDLENGKKDYEQGLIDYEDGKKQYEDALVQVADLKENIDTYRAQYDEGLAEYESGYADYLSGKEQLEDAKIQLDEGEAAYQAGYEQYSAGLEEFDEKNKEFEVYKKQFEEGAAEYLAGKAEYEKNLKELQNAREELDSGWEEYNNGKEQLDSARDQLDTAQNTLDTFDGMLDEFYEDGSINPNDLATMAGSVASLTVSSFLSSFTNGDSEEQNQMSELVSVDLDELESDIIAYNQALEVPESGEDLLQILRGEVVVSGKSVGRQLQGNVNVGMNALEEGQQQLDEAYEKLTDGEAQYADGKAQLDEAAALLEEAGAPLAEYEAQIADGQQQLNEAAAQLNDAAKELEENRIKLDNGRQEYEDGIKQLEDSEVKLADAKQQLDEAKAQLDEGEALLNGDTQLADAKKKLEDAEIQLRDSKKQIEDGEVDYQKGKEELESSYQQLLDGEEEYETQKAETEQLLAENEQKLIEGRAELEEGKATIAEKEEELRQAQEDADIQLGEALQELLDNDKKISDSETEYTQGLTEYETARDDALKEINDNTQLIRSARSQFEELVEGKWYVMPRDEAVINYSSYKNDTERIDAIATIFPLFFLIVAALVCLTTMSRMVEEQRTIMGTYKALGYSSTDIVGKFLFYAFLASAVGGILGQVICMLLLPKSIYGAYGIMYFLPELEVIYPIGIGIFAMVIGFACTALVAIFVCKKELRSTTAALMRPKAPKAGKKILLERITPLWKILPFSSKITARNLFRYKTRLIMTVIGIAGCMALIVSGFALYYSIENILTFQFENIYEYDVITAFSTELSEEEASRMKTDFVADDHISEAVFTRQIDGSVIVNGKKVSSYLLVPDADAELMSMINFNDASTGEKIPFDANSVLMTEKAAKVLSVKPGDTITFESGINQYSFTLTGIVENYISDYIYIGSAVYREKVTDKVLYNSMLALSKGSFSKDDFCSTWLSKESSMLYIRFVDSMIENFGDMFNSLKYIVVIMIAAAGLLALIVVYNLTNINISERIREIATIKVFGFTHFEVNMYVFRENIIMCILGILFGSLGGYFLAQFMISTVEVDVVMFPRDVPWSCYLFGAILTILFTGLVSILMSGKMKRISMVESLKAIE